MTREMKPPRTPGDKAAPVAPPPYTSRIIKAVALLADTKTLLAHWDTAATVAANFDLCRREKVFGKASRSRILTPRTCAPPLSASSALPNGV